MKKENEVSESGPSSLEIVGSFHDAVSNFMVAWTHQMSSLGILDAFIGRLRESKDSHFIWHSIKPEETLEIRFRLLPTDETESHG